MKQLSSNTIHENEYKNQEGTEGAMNRPSDEIFQEMRQMGSAEHDEIEARAELRGDADRTLPQEFRVKYLGQKEATGLWGIKHTRGPVDNLVGEAKQLVGGETLPFALIKVSESGVHAEEMPQNVNKAFTGSFFPIKVISYGVQDLLYTRVFAMIVVGGPASSPSEYHCHAFLCESRTAARRLTFALADAFQLFSKKVKTDRSAKAKKFAIDLRSAEEMEADLFKDSEA